MNYITKRNNLTETLEQYACFLRFCETEDDTARLIAEMNEIVAQLRDIKTMGRNELHWQVIETGVELPSKINYMEEVYLTPEEYYGKRTA